MPSPFRLLQAIADPFNEPLEKLPEPEFDPAEDPAFDILMRSDSISPSIKRALSIQRRENLQRQRIQFEIEKQRRKLEDEQKNPGVLSKLFGVPVGFQFGTFLGIEDPIARLAIDLIADPINLVSGVGGLTKLGRGAKFLKGLTPAKKASALAEGARVLARANVEPKVAKRLETAILGFDVPEIKRLFGQLGKRKLPESLIDELRIRTGDDDFANFLKNIDKESVGLRAAFEQMDRNVAADLQKGFLNQVISGQRGLVNIGLPGSREEITSLRFPKLLNAIKEGKLADEAPKAGTKEFSKAFQSVGRNLLGDSIDVSKDSALLDSISTDFNLLEEVVYNRTKNKLLGQAQPSIFELPQKTFLDTPEGLGHSYLHRSFSANQTIDSITKRTNRITKGDENLLEALDLALEGDPDAVETIATASPEVRSLFKLRQRSFRVVGRAAVRSEVIGELIEGFVPHIIQPTGKAGKEAGAALKKHLFKTFTKRTPEKTLEAEEKGIKKVTDEIRKRLKKKIESGKATKADLKNFLDDQQQLLDQVREERNKLAARVFGRRKLPRNRHALPRIFDIYEEAREFLRKNAGDFKIAPPRADRSFPFYMRAMTHAIFRNDLLRDAQKVRGVDTVPLVSTVKGQQVVRQFPLPMVLDREGKEIKALSRRLGQRVDLASRYERITNNPQLERYLVHKDVFTDFNAFFGRSFRDDLIQNPDATGKIARFLDGANSLAKASLFNISPFHLGSLHFSLAAALPPADAARVMSTVNRASLPVFFKGLKNIATDMIGISDNAAAKNQDLFVDAQLELLSKAYNSNADGFINAEDVIRRMRASTLNLDKPFEAEGLNVFGRLLNSALENLPERGILTNVFTGLKHLNTLWDRTLWGMYHTGFKAMSWLHMRQAALLSDPSLVRRPKDLLQLERDLAGTVNNAFGGRSWEVLGTTPNYRDLQRFAMLAPDWTTANLRQAADVVLNAPGIRQFAINNPIQRDVMFRDVRFHWALGYNVRAAFYWFTFGNLMNRAFTGRWIWENDEGSNDPDVGGFKTRVELPYTRKKLVQKTGLRVRRGELGIGFEIIDREGEVIARPNTRKEADQQVKRFREGGEIVELKQYMDILKQFKEPLKLFFNPTEFVEGKIGVLPRVLNTTVVGVDSFGRPLVGEDEGPFKDVVARIMETSGQFLPIPLQGVFDALEGTRDPRTALISPFGFSIRSEDIGRARSEQRIEELERRLSRLQGAR